MPKTPTVTDADLRAAISSLEDLAKAAYGMSLDELFTDDTPVQGRPGETRGVRDSHDAVWRVGRLIGITIKQEFAVSVDPTKPEPKYAKSPELKNGHSQTGASRAWVLTPPETPQPDLWQYRLVRDFISTEASEDELNWLLTLSQDEPVGSPTEVAMVARFFEDTHTERGVFRAIALGARKYLCDNTGVEAAVAGAVAGAQSTAKGRITAAPAQTIALGGFQAAAQAIENAITWLDPTMVPVIAGLLLVITAKGLTVFCNRPLSAEGTYVAET